MTDLDEALERVDTLLSLEEAIDPDRVYMREWRPAVAALSVIRAELAALRERVAEQKRELIDRFDQIVEHEEREVEYQMAMALFRCTIKSGEPWTDQCEEAYRTALAAEEEK